MSGRVYHTLHALLYNRRHINSTASCAQYGPGASKTKKVFLSQGSPGSKGVEGSDGDQVSEFSLSIVRLYDVYLFMIGI